MCGIAGFFFQEPLPNERISHALNKMMMALDHRGPDGHGWVVFTDKGIIADKTTCFSQLHDSKVYGGFVHTRLAIQDLAERSNQPMSCPQGRHWIVYNGEVYNFREIRATLASCGWSFRTESDTEVVLYACLEWGPQALDKFNGMYAFAVFDQETKELFCARDRIGIKPFYYILRDDSFLFASDATTLIASGLYEPRVNWEGIMHGLAFQGAPRPMTVYQDIQALRPGHYRLGVVPHLKQEVSYWDLPTGQHLMITENEALDQLEELLKRAVARCLTADVEVSTLMSGGIDSTTMTAFVAQQQPNIKAFTLAFDESLGLESELPQARLTASRYPLTHHVTTVSQEDIASSLDDMLWVFEEPIGCLEPHYPVAKHITNQGLKVVLNGLGPDEILGGYQYYRLLWQYWPTLRKLAPLAPFIPLWGRLSKVVKLMESQDPWDIHYRFFANNLWEDARTLFTEGQQLCAGLDSRLWMKQHLENGHIFKDPVQALSYADIKLYIGTHHNHICDRFLMRHQIEGRFPYLDHELVEFCYRLPPELKCRIPAGKYLLRELAAKYIDPSCLSMKKKGFGVPESVFFNESVIQRLKDRALALNKRGIFRSEVINQAIRDWNKSQVNARRLLYLAHFELWYQWFIERKHILFA